MIQKTDTKKETPKHILKANIIISGLFVHKFSIEFVAWVKRVCNENTFGIFLKYKERILLLSTTFVKYIVHKLQKIVLIMMYTLWLISDKNSETCTVVPFVRWEGEFLWYLTKLKNFTEIFYENIKNISNFCHRFGAEFITFQTLNRSCIFHNQEIYIVYRNILLMFYFVCDDGWLSALLDWPFLGRDIETYFKLQWKW